MTVLTTLFTHSSWCSNRFAVFIDDQAPGTSTIPPSSGWVDPSFTKCIPTQYTTAYPTFSPGVCPDHMGVFGLRVANQDGKTIYTATCCQRYLNPLQSQESLSNDPSGFSPVPLDPGYLCTSTLTSPLAFLLDPNISTADVYTTLPPELFIEHDQITVQWEPTDLELFPNVVSSRYARLMGITAPPATDNVATPATEVSTSSERTPKLTTVPMTSILLASSTPNTPATITSEPQLSTSESYSQATPVNGSALQSFGCSIFFLVVLFGLVLALMT